MSMTWRQGDHVRHKGIDCYIYWVMHPVALVTVGEREYKEVPLSELELISPIIESTTTPEAAEASTSGEIPEEHHVKKSEAQEQ